MHVRHVYAREPVIIHCNGLKLTNEEKPGLSLVRAFMSHMLNIALELRDCSRNHRCTRLCGQPALLQIGFPLTENLLTACPDASVNTVTNFEKILSTCIYDSEKDVEIQAIGYRFLPCPKILEIIDSVIYL